MLSRVLIAFIIAAGLAFGLAPLRAQLPITGAGPAAGGSNLTQIDQACSAVSGTTTTFSGKNLGSSGSNKINIVSISWADTTAAGTAEITGVTIGGVSALRASRAVGDNQNSNAEIWYASVATGGTGNIVVTSSTAVNRMTIAIYRLVNFSGVTPITTGVGTTSANVTVAAKTDAVIGIGTRSDATSTTLSSLTQNYSDSCGSGQWGIHSSLYPTTSGTVTTNISPTTNTPLISMAVWRSTAPNWVSTFSINGNSSNSVGWNGITLRQVIPASLMTQSGTGFRATLKTGFNPGCVVNIAVNSSYAGQAAAAGDAYDYDGTQVQMTSSGSTSYTIVNPNVLNTQASLTLDGVAYNFDHTKNFVLSFFFNTSGQDCFALQNTGVTGGAKYEKAGNDVATTNATGYSGPVSNSVYFVTKIEVLQ